MCRLVAYCGASLPLRVPVFGGSHSLFRQSWAARELLTGSVNVDGYGAAWAPGEKDRDLVRLTGLEPIWHDPDLPALLASISSPRILAALRNATPGLPVDRSGTLPFVHGAWALAMNGYVPEFRPRHMRALRAPLDDRWYGRLVGSSDAETLFLRILQEMEGGATPADAIRRVIGDVVRRLGEGQAAPLTLVLLGPHGITASHTTWKGPLNSLYLGRALSLAPSGTLLVSEPLTGEDGWEPVPRDSLVEITPGEVTVEPL